jgi:hypothetical protein
MAEIFDIEPHTISYHLKNVFEIKELDENSVYREIRVTAADGKNRMKNKVTTLHLYAQQTHHDEAYISGSLESLFALRKAVDEAIINTASKSSFFASDGEGYDLHIVCMSDDDAARQVPAYIESENDKNFGPWTLLLGTESR